MIKKKQMFKQVYRDEIRAALDTVSNGIVDSETLDKLADMYVDNNVDESSCFSETLPKLKDPKSVAEELLIYHKG